MGDRGEIIDTINRYPWALDLKQCDRLADVFAPDLYADYEGPVWTDLDSFIADMTRSHDRFGRTQHLIGSHVVSVDGDEAMCRSYGHNVLTRLIDSEWAQFSIGTRYEDRLRRTVDGWRVYRREARHMWRAGDRRVIT